MSENTEEFSSNALVVISNEYTTTPIALTKSASSTMNDIDNTPRILCNELIANPHNSKSLEKLDELSSLELEIAKMHHVDDTNLEGDSGLRSSSVTRSEKQMELTQQPEAETSSVVETDISNGQNIHNILMGEDTNVDDKIDDITSGETALEHEDLIAVLKGLDGNADETHNNSTSGASILEEGVTIEGEGEYQIMEVIDEDSNANEDPTKIEVTSPVNISPVTQTLNKTKIFGSKGLTAQEERALALEQIEGLKITQRRRKQDIKPIKQTDSTLDLVSALEADWSENDDDVANETAKSEANIKAKLPTIKSKNVASTSAFKSTGENKSNSPLITSVVVIPSVTASSTSTPLSDATSPLSNVSNANMSSVESMSDSKSSPVDGVIETKTEEDTHVVSSQTGFRRTRIIKRKIIWDPDAPETTFSYAKLVKSNNNTKTKTETPVTTSITKGSTTITPIKKEKSTTVPITVNALTKKTQRPTTPKAKKSPIDFNLEKQSPAKSENSGAVTKTVVEPEVTKTSNNKAEEIPTKVATNLETKPNPSPASPAKRRSQTPVANGPGGVNAIVKKKKVTELDRLMGDEGAVNMLNSLEKLEATLGAGESKPSRPMMRSRAATICEKLPRKETTSPARTSPPSTTNQQPQTNKGKRTPKSRASSTWDYVYKKKKQDFDDSLIIRRRSNSSYSSTTSLNRLSLDGPPATNTKKNTSSSSIKSDDAKSLPASACEHNSSKSTPSTLGHNRSSGSSNKTSSTPTSGTKSFEFAKPENKKSQKRTKSPAATLTTDMKKAAPVAGRRNTRSPASTTDDVKSKEVTKTPTTKSPTSVKDKKEAAPSSSTISDVVVKKSSKVAQILFNTNKAKINNTFTVQMLNKLVDILDKLAADPDCHVVVMGTNEAHFCQGIDLTELTMIATEKRKNCAVNLATSVKNYLKTLATYPKPLIAGVSGTLVNLGVMQLALFDVVIASDKTSFETPYAKIGQTPEGFCIWHNMTKIRGSFKTKLFWLCERVQSTEAALAGLVNKLTAANKVNDDAFAAAKRMATFSTESYRVMKKTIINSHLDVIVSSLDEEFDTIIKQWTSNECLDNIKKHLGQD